MPKYFLFSIIITLYFIITINHFCECALASASLEPDDNDDSTKDEETLAIPADDDSKIISNCSRGLMTNVHEIRKASSEQFPYVAALMSPEDEYVCAGSFVSEGIILTTAECADKANYILINTTIPKKGKESNIKVKISQKEPFPTHDKNVALIYVEKMNDSIKISKVSVSNFTKGEEVECAEAIGFGLNTEIGQTKILQYVGLYIKNVGDQSKGFLKCIDTTIPSCFKDKGGPVVVNDKLVGVVTDGASECALEITSQYDINKHILNFINTYVFKAWLDEKICKNKEKLNAEKSVIARRRFTPASTGKAFLLKTSPSLLIYLLFIHL